MKIIDGERPDQYRCLNDNGLLCGLITRIESSHVRVSSCKWYAPEYGSEQRVWVWSSGASKRGVPGVPYAGAQPGRGKRPAGSAGWFSKGGGRPPYWVRPKPNLRRLQPTAEAIHRPARLAGHVPRTGVDLPPARGPTNRETFPCLS